jgi:class 3 adenylate cyclase
VGSTIDHGRRAPRRIGRNVSVATRLALVVVVVALVSMVVTSLVGLGQGRDLANAEIRNRLIAVTAARVDAVERYVTGLERAVVSQAVTPQPAAAVEALAAAYGALEEQPPTGQDLADIVAYYDDVVVADLSTVRNRPVSATSLLPVGNAAVTLQARYVLPDGEARSASADLDAYSAVHDPLDDALREFARRSGFAEIYLVEPEELVVVYSSEQQIDFATSLRSGPHSGSQLAALVDELAADPTPGSVAIRDVAPYAPIGDQPAGFVGSPTFVDGELAGFVAARFTPEDLTSIMTSDQTWAPQGEAGESYLVAADGFMRSDSRLFLEDPTAFFERADDVGLVSEDEVRSMELFDTTVLFQPIDDRQVTEAMGADVVDVDEAVNYLGQPVLSDRASVELEGLDWVVFNEARLDVVREPIDDFVRSLLIAIAVFVVVVTFAAVRWADRLLEPLRRISDRLRSTDGSDDETPAVELPDSSADEFVELADDIETMLETLGQCKAEARRHTDELRNVLRRLLPPSVAERAEAGDRDVIEQVSAATVAVVVIGGLGTLMAAGEPARARGLLDRFVADADELGAERKLDRLHVTGDTYIAACGVSRPHLDHTARAAGFLLDVFDVLADIDPAGDLFVRAGLAVGPITVGLTGGSRLIHETWGVTVQRATDLARSARPGEALVSVECARQLPERYRLEASRLDGALVLGTADTPQEAAT